MTGGAAASPGADHERIGKVLSGNAVVCGVLDLARNLSADEWDAFAQSVERVRAGMTAVLRPGDSRAAS